MKKEEALLRLGSDNLADATQAAITLLTVSIHGDNNRLPRDMLLSSTYTVKDGGDEITVYFGRLHVPISISLKEIKDALATGNSLINIVFERLLETHIKHPINILKSTIRRPVGFDEFLLNTQRDSVFTGRTSEALRRLQDGTDLALIGQSASGKTVTAAQVCASLILQGWTISWLDVTDPERDPIDLLISLTQTAISDAQAHLVVIDNIQSNPRLAADISSVLNIIRLSCSSKISLLLLGWDSSRKIIHEAYSTALVLTCNGDDVFEGLVNFVLGAGFPAKDVERLRVICQGDLFVAKMSLSYLKTENKLPSLFQLATLAYTHVTSSENLSSEAVKVLYNITSLGQYEIDTSRYFAASISSKGLDELIRLKTVRVSGEFVTVGHRSLASLLTMYLQTLNKSLEDTYGKPIQVSVDYLRHAGDRQIVAMLERLDLARLMLINEDKDEAAFLAKAWYSLELLINYLDKQSETDLTWGDNLASAVFAAIAFSAISHQAWYNTAQYIRSRWIIPEDRKLPLPNGKPTSDRIDFDEIAKAMQEEDLSISRRPEDDRSAKKINLDLFHRTWGLGLLLSFEGSARYPDSDRIRELRECSEKAIEPDGNFYPARVPWVTARVILGLCSSGESIRSSNVVRRATDWLRMPYPDGPCKDGVWESGTGKWNSDVMTTAMCIIALIKAGISVDDVLIKKGASFLWEKKNEWTNNGEEIDSVLALEAIFLVSGKGQWREISKELARILSWSRDRGTWAKSNILASDSHDESSKVPFVAGSLIDIVWDTVKSELPLFLGTFAVPQIAHESIRRTAIGENGIRTVEVANMVPILFLAADPTDASRLRLGEELREIQEKLQMAKLRQQFQLHQRMSVRPADVSQSLLDVQPKIIHFSGHGTSEGALCLEDKTGKAQPVDPDALAALFEQFSDRVECVILNACYSEIQADAIAKHISYVIGMNQAIGDKAAIAFAVGFYQALGAGRTIEESYKLGCVQIKLQGIPEQLTPVLIKKA
jgi:hypothetical protein